MPCSAPYNALWTQYLQYSSISWTHL